LEIKKTPVNQNTGKYWNSIRVEDLALLQNLEGSGLPEVAGQVVWICKCVKWALAFLFFITQNLF